METRLDELFELIDGIGRTARFGGGQRELLAGLRLLQQAAIARFTAEEALLRARSAPRFFEHRRQHREFLSEIARAALEVERGGALDRAAAERLAARLAEHGDRFDRPEALELDDSAV